jgi:hypothetical protein
MGRRRGGLQESTKTEKVRSEESMRRDAKTTTTGEERFKAVRTSRGNLLKGTEPSTKENEEIARPLKRAA